MFNYNVPTSPNLFGFIINVSSFKFIKFGNGFLSFPYVNVLIGYSIIELIALGIVISVVLLNSNAKLGGLNFRIGGFVIVFTFGA